MDAIKYDRWKKEQENVSILKAKLRNWYKRQKQKNLFPLEKSLKVKVNRRGEEVIEESEQQMGLEEFFFTYCRDWDVKVDGKLVGDYDGKQKA